MAERNIGRILAIIGLAAAAAGAAGAGAQGEDRAFLKATRPSDAPEAGLADALRAAAGPFSAAAVPGAAIAPGAAGPDAARVAAVVPAAVGAGPAAGAGSSPEGDRPGRASGIAGAAGEPPREVELLPADDGAYGSGSISAPCSFDGHASRCLLDTGAGFSLVEDAPFSRNFELFDSGVPLGGASGTPVAADAVVVPRFALGPVPLGARHFFRYADAGACGGGFFPPRTEGLVGLDVLLHDRLDWLFGSRDRLVLDGPPPSAPAAEPLTIAGAATGLGTMFRKIVLPVGLGPERVQAVWDTLAGLSKIDREFVAAHPGLFEAAGTIDSYDIACARRTDPVYKVLALEVGGRDLSGEYVRATADFEKLRQSPGLAEARMTVGFNLIRRLDWHLDLKNRRWSAEAPR